MNCGFMFTKSITGKDKIIKRLKCKAIAIKRKKYIHSTRQKSEIIFI